MATFSGEVRQGLPRVPGGEPWPVGGAQAQGEATVAVSVGSGADGTSVVQPLEASPTAEVAETSGTPAGEAVEHPVAEEVVDAMPAGVVLRQGLPRVSGGEPWPAAGVAAGSAPVSGVSPGGSAQVFDAGPAGAVHSAPVAPAPIPAVAEVMPGAVSGGEASGERAGVAPGVTGFVAGDVPLRRGLPRRSGGEAWPAAGFAPATAVKDAASESSTAAPVPEPAASEPVVPAAPAAQAPVAAPATAPAEAAARQAEPVQQSASELSAQTVKPAKPVREPVMIRGKALAQWVKLVVLGAVGAIVAAGILVLAARGVTTLPGVPEWLERYPGEYGLPASAEPGFPWWARWSHALNIFLIVLIIRSGLLVRTQQQPPAFYTPKKGGKKISINLWLHTSLDVIWLVNGVIFVVLLFVSGHWMRIVPTSWEVFPNALSAMLQYATLDWPVENGWVNYNSIQQLMYFTVVFIAAPLAAITGVRMSEWWPDKAAKLNKIYPAPLARAIHFPTMLFFVLFIIVHVVLVFATGALKNLNHMFAGNEAVNWVGFWLFALTIFITVVGWVAARPLVLAPIASLFGRVSNR